MHVWTRSPWCAAADAVLGPLIAADRAGMLRLIELGLRHGGHAQLFTVDGPHYGGWFLIRWAEGKSGLECDCVAFAGRNTEAGLPDLASMVKKSGAVALTCSTEQEAVARLYKRQGWRVTETFLRFDL